MPRACCSSFPQVSFVNWYATPPGGLMAWAPVSQHLDPPWAHHIKSNLSLQCRLFSAFEVRSDESSHQISLGLCRHKIWNGFLSTVSVCSAPDGTNAVEFPTQKLRLTKNLLHNPVQLRRNGSRWGSRGHRSRVDPEETDPGVTDPGMTDPGVTDTGCAVAILFDSDP